MNVWFLLGALTVAVLVLAVGRAHVGARASAICPTRERVNPVASAICACVQPSARAITTNAFRSALAVSARFAAER
jgi:hypothetical protein